jgi:hypothetical protein
MALCAVEIAIEGTYWAPTQWVDITNWCRGFGTTRGRQHELQRVEAGTLELSLINTDGRFSPWNTNGPYYGALTPSQGVRVTAQWGDTTYNVFQGNIDSWVPTYGKVMANQVIKASDSFKLLALGNASASAYLNQCLTDGATLLWTLSDPPGSTNIADYTGNGQLGSISGGVELGGGGAIFGIPNTSAVFGAGDYVAGVISEAIANPTLEGWVLGSGTDGTDEPILRYGDLYVAWNSTGYLVVGNGTTYTASTKIVNDAVWHYFGVAYNNSTGAVTVVVDDAVVLSGTITTGLADAAGAYVVAGDTYGSNQLALENIAVYPTNLSSAQMEAHDQLGVYGYVNGYSGEMIAQLLLASGVPPTAIGSIATGVIEVQAPQISTAQTTTYDPGASSGPTPILTAVQQIETTEQGFFYVDETGLLQYLNSEYQLTATASNTSNGVFANDTNPAHYHFTAIVPALDDQDLWNDVVVSRQAPTAGPDANTTPSQYDLQNADSVAQFGMRSLTGYTDTLNVSDEDVIALGQRLLQAYSTPVLRVRQLTLDSISDGGANFPQMLGRKLLDRITVNWQPFDGSDSALVQDTLIEQITHTVTKAKWTTTWKTAPPLSLPAGESVLVWDVGKWDVDVWY